jgi:hypothetical protein
MQDLSTLWNDNNPAESLRRYAAALNEQARATFLESGTHVPLMFLFKTAGLGAVVPLVGSMEKAQMAETLRKHIQAENVFGVIHIAEAWAYLPQRKNDHTFKQLAQGEMRVADLKRGDQSEVLMLHMSSRTGASRLWLHPITRANGKASLGGALEIDEPSSGLFGNLFA